MADRVAYHAGSGYCADDGAYDRASLRAEVLPLGCGCFIASGRRLLLAEGNVAREDDVDSVGGVAWQTGVLGLA